MPADRLEDLAWLRDRSPVPIMVDESVWGPDDAFRVIYAGAADILNVYVSEAGGLRNSMRIFELAQSAGLQCTIGSMPELGIGTAAAVHLAAAARCFSTRVTSAACSTARSPSSGSRSTSPTGVFVPRGPRVSE